MRAQRQSHTVTNNLSFVTVLWIAGVCQAALRPGQTHAVPVLAGDHVAQLCHEGALPNDPGGCGEAIPLTAGADFSWSFGL
jgi:hypothetical protein